MTVAVYWPAGTAGSAEVKPTFVVQTSPLAGAAAAVVPTSRSAAGGIGIAASVVDETPAPSVAPAGAVAERPSGRSRGANAVRCTARL
ncbi:MAG TPA: hypothetical protein VFK17_08485 [Gaiellaceae bacterium]|nr:hypothetical protein [Gaiellaceae bacterium]